MNARLVAALIGSIAAVFAISLDHAVAASNAAEVAAPALPDDVCALIPIDVIVETTGQNLGEDFDRVGTSDDDGLEPRHWDIDKTAAWGGFLLTVEAVDTHGWPEDDVITITVSLTNDTGEVRWLSNHDYSLEVDGFAYTDQAFEPPPELPAGGRNRMAPQFAVDGVFELDAAVLVFGAPDQNQTRIPLGEGDIEWFEAQSLPVAGELSSATTAVTVTGEASVEPSYEGGERGVFIVRIPVELSVTGESSGGALLLPDQFALETPDGSSYLASGVATGDLIAEALYPNEPPTAVGIAFKVRGAPSGTYTISFTEADGTITSASFDLTTTSPTTTT